MTETLCIILSLLLWQQPETMDAEMDRIMRGVEQSSETAKPAVEQNEWTYPDFAKTDDQKSLFAASSSYWTSSKNAVWSDVYAHYWTPYQDKITLSNFINLEKGQVVDFEVAEIDVINESCALVTSYYSIDHAMMNVKRIKAKHKWFKQDDGWRIVADPSTNIMGINPPKKAALAIPCKDEFKALAREKAIKRQKALEKKRQQQDAEAVKEG